MIPYSGLLISVIFALINQFKIAYHEINDAHWNPGNGNATGSGTYDYK